MEDPFYATMKLITGEEVLAEVSHEIKPKTEYEPERDYYIVNNPIVINETMSVDHKKGMIVSGLSPKKWMMYANDDTTIIDKHHIISISEMDKFGTEFYSKALMAARMSSPIKRGIKSTDNSGFVGKVDEARNRLERLFDNT